MGKLNLLRNSTGAEFQGTWFKAQLTGKDLIWARTNLVKGSDGRCILERQPRKQMPVDLPYPDFVTSVRAGRFLGPNDVHYDGRPHPQVQVRIGEQYDFREAFHRAQAERDPELAPHIGFLKLAPGNDAVALGFIRECGPLFRKTWDAGEIVQVDLNDFWLKHSRFVAIARIFEAFSDPQSLYSVMADVSKNQDQLDQAGPASIGSIPDNDDQGKYTRLGYLDPHEFYLRKNPDGSSFLELELVRSQARKILFSELTLQTHEGIRSGWALAQEVDDGQIAFRPTRVVTSLWAAMWEMLGLETSRGWGWKSCRICARYFYPLQHNSDCCNPEHQALWSKRRYAKRRRDSEKLAASKRHRPTRKHD